MGEAVSDTDVLTSTGQMLAAVLNHGEVDLDDDFFALGGHSISAGRLTGRTTYEPGVRILLSDFFGDATVRGLTNLVLSALQAQSSP